MESFDEKEGKFHLDIYPYQDGDSRYDSALPPGPDALVYKPSVASFRRQIGGYEGLITGPSGDKYYISLKPWAEADQGKTLLRMEFGFTPNFEPLTKEQILEPVPVPVPNPAYTLPPHAHTFNLPGLPIYTMCSDVRYDHKLTLRPGLPGVTFTTAADLINLPESSPAGVVFCPVCDTPVRMTSPFAAYVQELGEVLGEPNPLMEWSITHPASTPETKIPPTNSPLVVVRYWRYEPVEVSPSAHRSSHMKVEVHSRHHIIRLEHGVKGLPGSFPADRLLTLPEANQKELICPLCDEKLTFYNPFRDSIETLASEHAGSENLLIWSISHPDDQPETKRGNPASLISARRHPPAGNATFPEAPDGVTMRFMV